MYAWLPTFGGARVPLYLKLENLQVGGGPQVRGALNAVLSLPRQDLEKGLLATYDGAGHCAAMTYIGRLLDLPVTVMAADIAPLTDEWIAGIKAQGARFLRRGETIDAFFQLAERYAADHDLVYIRQGTDANVLQGAGTLGLEVLQGPVPPSVIVVPTFGGSALLNGLAVAVKSLSPSTKVVGVELAATPHLHLGFQTGARVTLGPEYSPLSPRRVASLTFDLARRFVDEIVLVTQDELEEAAHVLWRELEVTASLVASYAVAAVLAGKVPLPSSGATYVLVAGMGEDGLF
jgi:threonine dehydratase